MTAETDITAINDGGANTALEVRSALTSVLARADTDPFLTTKGDLLTHTTGPARLGVGADDTVLTADSAEPSGVKWAAVVPGVQLQTGSYTGDTTVGRTISLPFTPKFVVVVNESASGLYAFSNLNTGTYGARFNNTNGQIIADDNVRPRLTTNGFIVSSTITSSGYLNSTGNTYHYIAVA